MKAWSLLFLVFGIITYTACKKKNTCMQRNVTSGELQGAWINAQQGDIAFAGVSYRYTFDGTAVYITEHHFSDIADTNTITCPTYNYTEYERAACLISGDTLTLNGNYTDSLHNPVDTGCFNTGVYQNVFKAYLACDSLYLVPLSINYPGSTLVFYKQ